MPRFFFDVHDGVHVIDDVGMEMANSEDARAYARQLVAQYASEPSNYGPNGHIIVVTRDGPSSVVSTIRMVYQEEVAITSPARPIAA